MNLEGKTIIVTGAARVGVPVAQILAAGGADIVLTYSDSPLKVQDAEASVRAAGRQAHLVQADLSKVDDITRVVEETKRAFGKVDGLVHMAAIYPRTPWKTLSEADWEKNMSVIAKSAFFMGKIVGDALLSNRGETLTIPNAGTALLKGKIVFFTDWSVLTRPYVEYSAYNAAKAAVEGITKSFAKELAPHITVNAVAPGPILPPSSDFTEEELKEATAGTLLRRWGGSEEIAKAVRYLFDSDFITGHVLAVDGGRTIA